MLNDKKERELCYTVLIDAIEPIVGSDNCEAAVVGGWRVMTRKGTFQPGDIAVYFEIDSKVPEREPFMFLAKKHFKVKTQKYTFGGKGKFISQGLLMSLKDFEDDAGRLPTWAAAIEHNIAGDFKHTFLTKELGVVYSVAEDNKRKSNITKYDKMYQRHLKLFKKYKILRTIYSKQWGKKLLFLFLGKKRDTRTWPDWVVKTDEERCQNLPQYFPGDGYKWIVTEKIDGSSTTFTMKKTGRRKDFYVCSRNVCFDKPEKADKCYYDTNIYLEMAEKYHIEEVLSNILDKEKDLSFVTIQGETYGDGIQKRDYGLKDGKHDFMAFNLVFGYKTGGSKRQNSQYAKLYLSQYEIPFVPILDITYQIPETCDDLLEYAGSEVSKIDGGMREGVVLRDQDGNQSFKAVDNEFLIKYHNG